MQRRKLFCRMSAIVLVAVLWTFPAFCGAGAHTSPRSGGIRLSNGLRIVSVTPQPEAPGPYASIRIAAEPTPHVQPPVGGFLPLVAVTTSDRRSGDDFDWEHRLENAYTGRVLNAPAEENYVIGILDTGASADLIAGSNADLLGLVGRYLTSNEVEVGGVGGTMMATVTQPVGIFAAGLAAIQPDGRLDLSQVVGHSNVCALVTPPIICGEVEQVTAALGNPLLAFKSTEIRVDTPRRAIVADKVYISPDVVIHSSYTPPVKEFPHKIPIELAGPTPVTTANYYAMFDPFDPLWEITPTAPTALSMFALSIPTGGAFFTEIGVLQGEPGPLNTIQNIRVMLDTGAQSSILHPNMAAKLNLPIEPDFIAQACGIGGLTEVPGYYIDYVRINALGGAMEFSRAPFVVLDVQSPEGGTLDGILGMNFFWNRNVVLEPSVSGGGYLHVSAPVPYAYVDLNFDDVVDMTDFAIFASAWRTTPADPAWNGLCDFYLDEMIDARDLQAFIDSWMNTLSQ